MKKLKYLTLLIVSAMIFLGCNLVNGIKTVNNEIDNGFSGIYITCSSLDDVYGAKRAYAGYNFENDFVYNLTAEIVDPETGLGTGNKIEKFTDRAYSALASGVKLEPHKYIFTLIALDKTSKAPALFGETGVIDLTTGGKTVNFVMLPVTGSTGSAKITFIFPENETLGEVTACITKADNPMQFSSDSHLVTKAKTSFTKITEDGTYKDFNKVELNFTDLESGVSQFAYILVNDISGKAIASRLESIEVIGGKLSTSTVIIPKDSYRTYAVTFTLSVDGRRGALKNRQIVLVDSMDREYIFNDDGSGTFTGYAADDNYKVYIRKAGETDHGKYTGLDYTPGGSTNVTAINLVSVTLSEDKGISYSNVVATPAPDNEKGEKVYYVVSGKDIKFDVALKPGYKSANPNGTITVNGNTVNPSDNVSTNDTVTISNITASPAITVTGLTKESYTIKFEIGEARWVTADPGIINYDVETEVDLPLYTDISLSGKMLDGWQDSETLKKFARIPKGTTGNLVLNPVWKDGVKVDQPENWTPEHPTVPGNFTVAPSVFACGYSLIIKWSGDGSGETNIYIDYDSDGVLDDDEKTPISGSYNPSTTDFTGYKLEAKNADGTLPASNFKYTILGGKLASLTGLGHENQNQSIVNISGKNTVIGNGVDVGINLPSLTNEWVYIDKAMSGSYHITLETQYVFDIEAPTRKVAYIKDPKYADPSNFTCINKGTKEKLGIGYLNVTENGSSQTIVYLKNPHPISLPAAGKPGEHGGIVPEQYFNDSAEDKIIKQFTLGSTASINERCSVFSLTVKNGSFFLEDTTMNKVVNGEETADVIPTSNLGRLYTPEGTKKFETALVTGKPYVYLHMLSEANEITPETTTAFLKKIHFVKESENPSKKIEITVHLEKVPYSLIKAMKDTYGAKKFNYYDGSFYLGITKGSKITWTDAYNEARSDALKFNSLRGYLINITSEIENDYIYSEMGLGAAWTGGARLDNREGHYDSVTIDSSNGAPQQITLDTTFRWQSGPEAGQAYTTGTIPTNTVTTTKYKSGTLYGVSKLDDGTFYDYLHTTNAFKKNDTVDLLDVNKTKIGSAKISGNYSSSRYQLSNLKVTSASAVKYVGLSSGISYQTESVQLSGQGKYSSTSQNSGIYTNWDGGEPNDSRYDGSKYWSEQCMHFIQDAGNKARNGKWNDYAYNYDVKAFIVEYTQYGIIEAGYPAINATASY